MPFSSFSWPATSYQPPRPVESCLSIPPGPAFASALSPQSSAEGPFSFSGFPYFSFFPIVRPPPSAAMPPPPPVTRHSGYAANPSFKIHQAAMK